LKDEIIGILKAKHDITVENGKLAIWLSEDKQNRDTISINDDKAEVMIFKQAIAIGWDCPRAHILVMLREMHSFVFTIQTVGRIMRMPELKHYTFDALNIGYIYTNMPTFSIRGEESFGYIVTQKATRKAIYSAINLPSVHSKRHREETRLAPQFISSFLQAAEKLKLKENINPDVQEISKTLLSDVKVEDIDKAPFGKVKDTTAGYIADKGDQVSLVQQETEIQHAFELFAIKSLQPMLFPEPRSVARVKEAIYTFFKKTYPADYKVIETKMQLVVLKEENEQCFLDAINMAKEIYVEIVGKAKSTLEPDGNWNVPEHLEYPAGYTALPVKLPIVEPFYQNNDASKVEKDFVPYLESKADVIEWWYKNGQNDAKHFAVPYDDNGVKRAFYVDWIVKYKNGKLGLFDTKLKITAETAKSKAEGLYQYIKEQNAKGKNLFGGIVIPHSGSWRYNNKAIYDYNIDNLKSWEFL
jgi:type III restriction enzyme